MATTDNTHPQTMADLYRLNDQARANEADERPAEMNDPQAFDLIYGQTEDPQVQDITQTSLVRRWAAGLRLPSDAGRVSTSTGLQLGGGRLPGSGSKVPGVGLIGRTGAGSTGGNDGGTVTTSGGRVIRTPSAGLGIVGRVSSSPTTPAPGRAPSVVSSGGGSSGGGSGGGGGDPGVAPGIIPRQGQPDAGPAPVVKAKGGNWKIWAGAAAVVAAGLGFVAGRRR